MPQNITNSNEDVNAVVPLTPGRNLKEVVEKASHEAELLDRIIRQRRLFKRIGDSDHLYFEAWQLIATRYGASPKIEKTEPIYKDGKISGWKASAVVLRQGRVIGGADHICMVDEKNHSQDQYAVMSKAQTRAASKALRFVFAWVVQLAGFNSMPAEESECGAVVSPSACGDVISEAQRKRLYAIWKSANLKDDYVKEFIAREYGYQSTTEILRKDYDAIIDWIQCQQEPGAGG